MDDLKAGSNSVVSWRIFFRDPTLILWIKSEKLEELFKRVSLNTKEHPLGACVESHIQTNPTLEYLRSAKMWKTLPFGLPSDRWSWSPMSKPVTSGGFNVRALTIVGLAEGLEFPLEYPMSHSMLKEFGRAITACCREYVLEYGTYPYMEGSVNAK